MVNEDELTVMIINKKYVGKKFRTMGEALKFINKNCPDLWTHLFTYIDDEWRATGSTWSKN